MAGNLRHATMDDFRQVSADARDGVEQEQISPEHMEAIFACSAQVYAFGDPACVVFGLITDTLISDEVYVWMVTGRGVDRCPVAFGRATKRFLAWTLTVWPHVTCHCVEHRPEAGRWLRSLGGTAVGALTTLGIKTTHYMVRRA